ncbi:cbb3-type cytochrome c oxidase subunit 3 [Massilia sp. W12]|uniref:cbb3-type cytochrome oxidase subunit 3 n=1 Tax=Massilia sp. W12 TaxID=3126507 RepID=UPI0030CEDBE4
MDFNLLSAFFTGLSMLVFCGIVYWAYSRENSTRFEQLGSLPLDEGSTEAGDVAKSNKEMENNHG